MKTVFPFIVISLFIALLIGCASVPPDETNASIPWNQPQSWENNGFAGPSIGF